MYFYPRLFGGDSQARHKREKMAVQAEVRRQAKEASVARREAEARQEASEAEAAAYRTRREAEERAYTEALLLTDSPSSNSKPRWSSRTTASKEAAARPTTAVAVTAPTAAVTVLRDEINRRAVDLEAVTRGPGCRGGAQE